MDVGELLAYKVCKKMYLFNLNSFIVDIMLPMANLRKTIIFM